MKKFLSLVTAVLMLLSLVTAASAADITNIVGETNADVYAKYIAGAKQDTYKVNLTWGSMHFDYTAESTVWNAENHTWNTTAAESWAPAEEGADIITVVNHSSLDVYAAFAFAPTAGTGIEGGTFTHGASALTASLTVGNALAGTEVTETVSFLPAGSLIGTDANTAGYVGIGQITVTLS